MGTVGAATAPLWLPEIYGARLVLGGNPTVQYIKTLNHMYGKDVKRIGLEYATGQGLERIGDFMMKHTTGMDSDQASYKLLSPLVEPLDITDG